jgi:hypothetical protein
MTRDASDVASGPPEDASNLGENSASGLRRGGAAGADHQHAMSSCDPAMIVTARTWMTMHAGRDDGDVGI